MTPWGMGAGLGNIGNGLYGLFNPQKTPASAADPYLGQISGQTGKYFDPYFNAGKDTIPQLQGQYGQLTNDPGGKLNSIGESYQQSPGFKFALQQALQGAGHASAAGGMAGSPQDSQQQMQMATDMASQDYNNWLQQATGMYNSGLQGQQGMMNNGMQAGSNQADMIAQQLSAQAQNASNNQNQKNQQQANAWGNIFSGIGQGIFG